MLLKTGRLQLIQQGYVFCLSQEMSVGLDIFEEQGQAQKVIDEKEHHLPLRTAVSTAAKEGQCMPFNDEVLLIANGRELSSGQAEIDIDNAMALCAGEVVVMVASSADAVVMGSIRKLNAGEQSSRHQLFDRTIDRRSANARLDLTELLPEFLNGEIRAEAFQLDQTFRNELAWARVALAHFVERCIYFLS
jgi:hypothetical protein